MRNLRDLWSDEQGAVMSAEMVMLGTVGVVGATVGLNMASSSVREEMKEVAYSIRHLDQSYGYEGQSNSRAWTAGSSYTQPPVEESIARLESLDTDRLPQDEGPDGAVKPGPKAKPENVDPNATPEKKPALKKKNKKFDETDETSDDGSIFESSARNTDA